MRLISKQILNYAVPFVKYKHQLWRRILAGMWHNGPPQQKLLICYNSRKF